MSRSLAAEINTMAAFTAIPVSAIRPNTVYRLIGFPVSRAYQADIVVTKHSAMLNI